MTASESHAPSEPDSPTALQALLKALRRDRAGQKARSTSNRRRRASLSNLQRARVLAKTGGRCHICGGLIAGGWQADHVLAHSGGGGHSEDNYLPAHALCNNYRWDYSAEEFQLILKFGVWARTQVETDKPLGRHPKTLGRSPGARRMCNRDGRQLCGRRCDGRRPRRLEPVMNFRDLPSPPGLWAT